MSTLNLSEIEALIIDMDGVLWLGRRPLPGLEALFGLLDERGIPYVLATNNASNTPTHYIERMAGYGVAITADNILTSALAAAEWLKTEVPAGGRVYMVGQDGLREALSNAGFEVIESAAAHEEADVVIAGIDFSLTYAKLRDAALLIRRGARFIGTNGDVNYPSEQGLAPGGGAILAAIEAATGVSPTIVGKPELPMFEAAVARLDRPRQNTAMIGDRLETDILGAHRAGLRTILVTTGVDDPTTVRETGIIPDAIFDDLLALTEALRESA